MDRLINSHRGRLATLVVLALAVAGAWLVVVRSASHEQNAAARRTYAEAQSGERMLKAMLDQETGVRGFVLTRRHEFLDPWRLGRRDFEVALRRARSLAEGNRAERRSLARQERLAGEWRRGAARDIAVIRRGTLGDTGLERTMARKARMDRFRVANADFQTLLGAHRDDRLESASRRTTLWVVVVSLLVAALGYALLAVRSRLRTAERERQLDFARTLQFAETEAEARELVVRHVERCVPGGRTVLLARDGAEDRLQAATDLPEGSTLAAPAPDATPRSCLAIRLGALHERGADQGSLLACEVCGRLPERSTCIPLIIRGEVIGSVLTEHPRRLDQRLLQVLVDSVNQATPVLANLRNLALAELRAATDALTGLANRRTIDETLRRMIAQAGRSVSPLAAILLDIDRFKEVNDSHGHERGDEVLAAVADVLRQSLRAGDFVGRNGGEEFLVLLPDTDLMGARTTAENLRAAIERVRVPGVDLNVTASLGVAVYPDTAGSAEELLRGADRALYLAKDRGRNRVEAITAAPDATRVPG